MRNTTRGLAGLALAAVLTATATACGDADTAPSEQVPALGRKLDQVDAAIASGDYQQARTAVEALVAETAQAQVSGDLSSEDSERILKAARSVLMSLPEAD